jgi:hypothetical protein
VYATIHAGTPEEKTLRRENNTNAGTFNQSDLPIHLGLGDASMIDVLKIVWPDGTVQILHDLAVDRYLHVAFPGDFNGDRIVNGADLLVWRNHVGVDGGADADGDGDTDGADFLAWQRGVRMGASATAATGAVPEPASAALLVSSVLGGMQAQRRRRRRAA